MKDYEYRHACPPAHILERFIDGALERTATDEIARHLENCRDCRFVVHETVAFLRESAKRGLQPERSRVRWWIVPPAAALVVLTLYVFVFMRPEHRFDRAVADTPMRPIEGRLYGLEYQKYSPRRGTPTAVPPHILALADAVVDARPRRASDWHRRGIANIVRGDAASGVASLVHAVALAPREARYWSDLAAARLALGADGRDDAMLAVATRDAMQAVHLDPDLREAHFNLGLALERRQLSNQARAAYVAYLSLDRRSLWAAEVQGRLANLSP